MSAIFSECSAYRYVLNLELQGDGERVLFICMNPSSANSMDDDSTSNTIKRFADNWGASSAHVVNLFAYIETKQSKALKLTAEELVGPENDDHIMREAQAADRIVIAWGENGGRHGRSDVVLGMLNTHDLWRIGLCGNGQPWHPLFKDTSTPLQPYRKVKAINRKVKAMTKPQVKKAPNWEVLALQRQLEIWSLESGYSASAVAGAFLLMVLFGYYEAGTIFFIMGAVWLTSLWYHDKGTTRTNERSTPVKKRLQKLLEGRSQKVLVERDE